MSTLLNRLKTERSGDYELAITPVEKETVVSANGFMLEKPLHGIFAKSKDLSLIHI